MPGMEAIAIRAADGEQADGALFTQRYQRYRADIVRVRAEQELALRITRLTTAGLAAREQSLEGLQVRIVRTDVAYEALLRGIRRLANQHQHAVKRVEILTQAGFDAA